MEVVLPLAIAAVVITALVKKTDIIGAFTEGARDGMKATAGILPVLMLMLTAIGVFRASGGMDILVWLLSPVANIIGMPAEVLPVAVIKPFSGSGAIALLDDVIKSCGVDSFAGTLAAVIASSTETTFYTLSVYGGQLGKKCGRVLFCALAADCFSATAATVICRFML